MEDQEKNILLSDDYKPASELLGEGFDNWYFVENSIPTKKNWQVFINGHTHNLPIENKSILFRWFVPASPNLYSEADAFSPEDRKVGIYRLTCGEKFEINDEEIKKLAKGVIKADRDYLTKLNALIAKTVTFNTWKIPYADVRMDHVPDNRFDSLFELHEGSVRSKITELVEKKKQAQSEEKIRLLGEVKERLRAQPDYLSILRQLVREEVTVDEAIRQTQDRGIITKGI